MTKPRTSRERGILSLKDVEDRAKIRKRAHKDIIKRIRKEKRI